MVEIFTEWWSLSILITIEALVYSCGWLTFLDEMFRIELG
jgi:hypothetical protein